MTREALKVRGDDGTFMYYAEPVVRGFTDGFKQGCLVFVGALLFFLWTALFTGLVFCLLLRAVGL